MRSGQAGCERALPLHARAGCLSGRGGVGGRVQTPGFGRPPPVGPTGPRASLRATGAVSPTQKTVEVDPRAQAKGSEP